MIIVCLLAAVAVHAQTTSDTKDSKKKEKKINIGGSVYDSFTRSKLPAFITLMDQDSTVVDTMTCHVSERGSWSWYYFNVPRVEKKYIVKASYEGYQDCYVDFEIKNLKRKQYYEIPQHLMKIRRNNSMDGRSLNELVVKGTRVQIAYRGDTIVYDAAAFNLPEGSMLDGLIRQMPGAEIKDNGDIYVNGKKIENLLLNGKNFFKGDNKVMLENLPYFTVKNVQVYHKSTEKSELVGRDIEEKEYVMDVKLKREYARGYIANAEAGAGTEERWMGRAFGLFYNDHTRLSAFANINNVNEDRKPGNDGDWKPADMPRGLLKTRQVGVDLETEDKEKTFNEGFSSTLTWKDADNETSTASESFATDGSIYRGSSSKTLSDDFRFQMQNRLNVRKLHLHSFTWLSYNNGNSFSESRDSTFATTLTNRRYSIGRNKNRSIDISQYLFWVKSFESGDYLQFNFSGDYYSNKPAENFSLSRTDYVATGKQDLRNSYTDSHTSNYSYSIEGNYQFALPDEWELISSVGYFQNQQSVTNGYYRLDMLDNERYEEFGLLPSTRDSLDMTLDADNSRISTTMVRRYTGRIELSKYTNKMSFRLSLPVYRLTERMNYHSAALDTTAHRAYTAFEPYIFLRTYGKTQFQFKYVFNVSRPDFASLMPVSNDSDPLSIRINNPNIKNRKTHKSEATVTFKNDSLGSSVYVGYDFRLEQNARGTRTTYNSATGAYTRMTDNVDGNWSGLLKAGWQRPIDRKKRLRFDVNGSVKYERSVDFDIAYDTDADVLSKVTNIYTRLNGKVSYRYEKLSAALVSKLVMRNSTGNSDNFEHINTYDYQYGGNAQYTIPGIELTVATDINMFCRRGYSSSVMNTDDLVWNAQLTRSFFKGRLTAKLQAFDLLHRLSNVRYNINAQGRTETWYNCIPRYVMLTAAYKFTKKPEKKK